MTQVALEKRISWRVPKTDAPTNPMHEAYKQLEEAELARQERRFDRARKICESLLDRHPDYMGALHTLGCVYADKREFKRALNYLIQASMLNPRSWRTLTVLAGVYVEMGASETAAQTLEQARLLNPRDPSVLVTLGVIYQEEREYELARDAFRDALAVEPDLEPAAFGLAEAYISLGENAEAAKVLGSINSPGSRAFDRMYMLAGLPASFVKIDLLAELDRAVNPAKEDPVKFQTSLAFARAAVLDKAGRYTEAWEQLIPANCTVFRAREKDLEHARQRQRAMLESLKANSSLIAEPSDSHPISLFVLGASRSGKTTMERLIATLPGVKRGYENPIVENTIRRTFQDAALLTSRYFELLPPKLYAECGNNYCDELRRRAASVRVFTNTHPVRVHDAERMASVFPNVRFILVKRDIEDSVLRIFMRNYTEGNAYGFELNAAREHVLWYHQMIDLLAQKLPNTVRVIHYEDMVADPTAALRAAAELCGLPMPDGPVPPVGDDRGCAEPYRDFMAAELNG